MCRSHMNCLSRRSLQPHQTIDDLTKRFVVTLAMIYNSGVLKGDETSSLHCNKLVKIMRPPQLAIKILPAPWATVRDGTKLTGLKEDTFKPHANYVKVKEIRVVEIRTFRNLFEESACMKHFPLRVLVLPSSVRPTDQ